MNMQPRSQCGFTLVEMIIVIVITGIIGGMVAMFIRAPVQGYVDSSRRAEMTDIADTALRRLARDLRTAVPNSVRLPTPAGSTYIEFLPTRDGGRYRVNDDGGILCGAAGDDLAFNASDTCFAIIGSPIPFLAGDAIVVGSTQSSGNPPYCKTTTCTVAAIVEPGVLRDYTGAAGAQAVVVMAGAAKFPDSAEVEGYRFEVVPGDQQAVTYACVNPGGGGCATGADGDGTCQLMRYWSYGFNSTQVAPAALAGPSTAILADRVSACNFVYDIGNKRNSLVAVSLTITRGNESVNLYHEIHINNIP
ncbi:MAG: prepilin-type N-terminal cleavage/methylation domain-containing protein [Nitrosomonadales bacterium]|nr:prepilin-type N-terminal cleavage/methylation domain-containing protein [Nitrosomonadales bacterium]